MATKHLSTRLPDAVAAILFVALPLILWIREVAQ